MLNVAANVEEVILENYSEKHLPYRKMKFIPDLLDKYEHKFGIRPVRHGKEDKFVIESKDGQDIFTAGELWGRVWGQISHNKKEEKKRKMDMENLEVPTEKRAVKVKKSDDGKLSLKQMTKDAIAQGKTEAEVKTIIVDRYVSEGKDAEWAAKRAKAIYYHIINE